MKCVRPHIAAVVLAAGQSSRMGANKLLGDFHGQPLLAHTVAQVLSAGPDAVVVVTGFMAAEIHAALAGQPISFAHNTSYATGLATSIRTGIAAVRDFDAAFICLGDMPLVHANDLRRMMAAFNMAEGQSLIAPTLGGKLGNPVLWGQEYFSALMELEGDRGARNLLEARRDVIVEINVAHEGIMLDADTPEALALLHKKAAEGS